MSTALKDTFTVISSALQDGYSVQVGDITTELPGMSLDTARKCLFAYANKHSRDVEVDFCILGTIGMGNTDMVIVTGKEGLDQASLKFDRILTRYVYRLRAVGKESHYSPHALAPTVLHATTSDKCREIVTDVKQIAPKVHEVPLSATQIEITKAQEKANPLAAMFAKAAQKKAAKEKDARDEKLVSKEKPKSPARAKASKTARGKANPKTKLTATTPKKVSPSRSPMETDEEEEDEDDIMVMPKRKRRGDTMAKRQREATPEKKKEEPKAPSVSAGLFGGDDDEEKETGERPGDENSSLEHNGGDTIEVKRRKKTTETNFSLGEGGYMEVQDVVGFKEITETVKRAAPVAAKPKAKSGASGLSRGTKRGGGGNAASHSHQTKLTSFFTKKN
ncbi:Chromo domain protein cec-1, putative [Perkinsus marinus ATCC 50983]|uniref:Chromo domain protein cec-1, putative n=1 Tax=Perkinsus marinus (strain ATCC 50983 / TXsc) TaxID=423536 RepID=C5K9T3_PERM5|nr:Chromo domain protein cec-1, putative [Perkinsus marinus ATCC 50983]EER18855.1 Chromo domain protein cec-1, putative [Perkinsus marinus ATCC 50983]|eukprot:XP_002787059.1 Chromo domain protein cec-1, putative [Perkinsus marinus ATCC 50983]